MSPLHHSRAWYIFPSAVTLGKSTDGDIKMMIDHIGPATFIASHPIPPPYIGDPPNSNVLVSRKTALPAKSNQKPPRCKKKINPCPSSNSNLILKTCLFEGWAPVVSEFRCSLSVDVRTPDDVGWVDKFASRSRSNTGLTLGGTVIGDPVKVRPRGDSVLVRWVGEVLRIF